MDSDVSAYRIGSHSTRVRGLKFVVQIRRIGERVVALYTSAWIEIWWDNGVLTSNQVALYTSAWIEMLTEGGVWASELKSHSTRVRGLK